MGGNRETAFTEPHHLKGIRTALEVRETYEARLARLRRRKPCSFVRDITEQAKLNEMKSDFINRASGMGCACRLQMPS